MSNREVLQLRRKALSVEEFCRMHSISKAFFYKVLGQGRGPRITKLGRRSFVMVEDAEIWRQQLRDA
jgi:hypothetical protein